MRKRILLSAVVFAAALVAGGFLAGCTSPVSPLKYAPFSQTDLQEGTGEPVINGDVLIVDYTGWLYDPSMPDSKGLVFDTSLGTSPFQFTLGNGQVIQGWDRGLVGMKVGGKRRLVIPPSLGYGGTRRNEIPPFSTMLFEVELVSAIQ
jgi:FKBP-type peptidyl-prolyl cis-trans isomerase FkpA